MKRTILFLLVVLMSTIAFNSNAQNPITASCVNVTVGGSNTILIVNGGLYRLTIRSCWMSANARIGSYLISGLNIFDVGQPEVLTIAETPNIDWTFSYSLSGSYDADMTITSSGWGDQGLFVVLEELSSCNPLKVEKPVINDLINIYPNPTENTINVEINSQNINSFDTEIYNVQGKLIFMKNYKSNSINIDISDFSKGMYLLKIKDEKGNIIKTEKIVKE